MNQEKIIDPSPEKGNQKTQESKTSNNNNNNNDDIITDDYYQEYIPGMIDMWNNDFIESEEFFQNLLKKTKNARALLHYSESIIIKSYITASLDDTDLAIKRVEKAKDYAYEQLKYWEKGISGIDKKTKVSGVELWNSLLDCRIVYGEALYILALLQISHESPVYGALNLRRSWKVFQGSWKDISTPKVKKLGISQSILDCLRFDVGLFLYAMSVLPNGLLVLLKIFGFEADRTLGLSFIHECHNKNGIRAPLATLVLLLNNLILPRGLMNPTHDLEEAERLLKITLEKYPKNSLFYVLASQCSRKLLDLDKSIYYMEKALESCRKSPSLQTPLNFVYELSNCYMLKMQWKDAIELFNELRTSSTFENAMVSSLQAAGCYYQLNEPNKAKEIFQNMSQIKERKKKPLENVAISQAKKYLLNGGWYCLFEVLYMRRDLVKMFDKVPDMLDLLDEVTQKYCPEALTPKKPPVPKDRSFGEMLNPFASKKREVTNWDIDNRCSYLLLKGALTKAFGRPTETIPFFEEVILLAPAAYEKFFAPYACVELAEVYFQKKDIKQAQNYVKIAWKYTDYDWVDPLDIRLKIMSDQLKQAAQRQQQPTTPVKKTISLEDRISSLDIGDDSE